MRAVDLSGEWRYETDTRDNGINERFFERTLSHIGFKLPGDACANCVGKKYTPPPELCYEAVRTLRPEYEYIGPLWLQREFELPEDFEDKCLTLFFERINGASDLWLDGKKISRRFISLCAPHTYDLTGRIKAGKHTITLRLDNSNIMNLEGMSSGYSVDTQSIWNGVIGRIYLGCEEIFHLSNVQVTTEKNGVSVKVSAHSDCLYPDDRRDVRIEVSAETPSGKSLKPRVYDFTLFNKVQPLRFTYPIRRGKLWDEFNPSLYKLRVKMIRDSKVVDEKTVTFGMREVGTDGTEFTVNGRKTALRGTLDCAIYPLTGHPPTDINEWLRVFKTVKEYGLNHVRFHSWCPPEAAFKAADMTGVYVLAEMPLWLNVDVTSISAGDDMAHEIFFHAEAKRISEWYGNHPSFIMFSNGNENLGDFEMLEDITTQIKAFDKRRLYTLTSNFDRPVSPADDYFSAFEAGGNRVRVQVFHDVISEHTRLNYDKAIKNMPLPVVSFEVGQYCVYPDVDSISDYTGSLKPVNFEYIKNELVKHGVYGMLDKFKSASGAFAAMMYKEEIEASMRTRHMGGFELLGLCDYTGQGTATIGMLDVFWKSKGIITPEKFRSFCNSTVPLMKADRVFKNTDIFKAELDLYNYGEKRINVPLYKFELLDGDDIVYKKETRSKTVFCSLDFVTKPTALTVRLTVGEYTNEWEIYVYTDNTDENEVVFTNGIDDKFREIVQNGGKAIVMMNADNLVNPIEGLFKPTFWSPAHFPSERTNGLMIDSTSGAFREFPTGEYGGFQWKHPIDNCICANVSGIGSDCTYLVEPVPNYYSNIRRSPLFEAKVGNGSFLFCGFDMSVNKTTVTALKNSILAYVESDGFSPSNILSEEDIKKLFK